MNFSFKVKFFTLLNPINKQQQNRQQQICRYRIFNQIWSQMTQYQLIQNDCPNLFCGSKTYEDGSNHSVLLQPKICIFIAAIIIIVIGSVKLSMEWFIFKDYYPLKQKSPLLCILMIACIAIQLLLYPVIYTSNYFTCMFNTPSVRYIFRAIQSAFEFTMYFIYVVRCFRIYFAHETHSRRSLGAKIFSRQYVLAFIIVVWIVLRGIYTMMVLFINEQKNLDFALSYQIIQSYQYDSSVYYKYYIVRTLIVNFCWQLLLIYCFWLQKTINFRYSMKNQLMIILALTQLTNLTYIITLAIGLSDVSNLSKLCKNFFPLGQFSQVISFLIAIVVSTCLPLRRKKIYHIHLPYEPQFGLLKTMRNYLMQQQFLHIFSKFLQYLDHQNQNHHYIKILKFWEEMIKIKIDSNQANYQQFCQDIKSLITEISDGEDGRQSVDLVHSIKNTIIGVYEHEQRQQNQNFLTNINLDRKSFIQKTDTLEQLALNKLYKIYVEKYCYTQSYFRVKEIVKDYDRIRLNMVVFNFSIVVDRGSVFN